MEALEMSLPNNWDNYDAKTWEQYYGKLAAQLYLWVKGVIEYHEAFVNNVKPLRDILEKADAKHKFDSKEENTDTPEIKAGRQKLDKAK